ncbi:hypothetical protein LJC60_08975 [Ruminococcaceae bacterium OttesenSCG-928-D13]|nr:hypothetical protein [Ruminococcaceae bacterium OttesenSCG-928-D13]
MDDDIIPTVPCEDADGESVEIPVSKQVLLAFEEFDKADERQKKEEQRHGTNAVHDNVLGTRYTQRLTDPVESVEEQADADELRETLLGAIGKLTVIQQRRVMMRFFMDMRLEDIARREQVDLRAIHDSLELALKRLKKLLGEKS